jgi:hypothetical protein
MPEHPDQLVSRQYPGRRGQLRAQLRVRAGPGERQRHVISRLERHPRWLRRAQPMAGDGGDQWPDRAVSER